MSTSELALISEACRQLDVETSIERVMAIRNKAEAVRTYARNARLGRELTNKAAALKLRAERRAGELLSSMRLRGGDRKSKGHRDPLKLDDLGISRNESKRWQLEASVPCEVFEQFVAAADQDGIEISSAALLRMARKHQVAPVGPVRSVADSPRPLKARTVDVDVLKIVEELKGHHSAVCSLLESASGPEPRETSRLLRRYLEETRLLLECLENALI